MKRIQHKKEDKLRNSYYGQDYANSQVFHVS